MSLDLKDTTAESRADLYKAFTEYILTDVLLFVPDDSFICERYGSRLENALASANRLLQTQYISVCGLEVSALNFSQKRLFMVYLEKLSDEKLVFWFLAAALLHSVLLGLLFVEGEMQADETAELSLFEESCQRQKWGEVKEVLQKQKEVAKKLELLKIKYYERSVS